jgi:hypothetical protein
MDDTQDLNAVTEAEGRRLLATAFETVPAGTLLAGNGLAGNGRAGNGLAGAELLRRVRRRTARRRRARTLVPAGAVAALGGAAALGVTLTATVADAPSALAAVTAAAAKTSAESFQLTSTEIQTTTIVRSSPVHYRPVRTRITGVFDPRRGLAEETVAGVSPVRIVGGHMYAQRVVGSVLAHGKLWVEGQVPPPPVTPGQNPGLAEATNSVEPVDPSAVLGVLKSAVSVQAEGPASGPGWTGTKYAFTKGPYTEAGATGTTRGTVYVDDQGRVRRLVVTGTFRLPGTPTMHMEVGYTYDVTFGEFGVQVSVTAPPASQVYNLGQGYLVLDPGLGFLVVSPPVAQ